MVLSFLILFWTSIVNQCFIIKSSFIWYTPTSEKIIPKYSSHYHYSPSLTNQSSEIAILLIHGFASNHHHWRSNVPVLSQLYDTYAIDLIGCGNSSKPTNLPYSITMWSEQVLEFINHIIKKPCIIVGNSIGGYIALVASSLEENNHMQKIKGIITINPITISKTDNRIKQFEWIKETFLLKSIIKSYFYFAEKRTMIQSFLKTLYPVFPNRVDDFLIDSIETQFTHPNASDIFYQVLKQNVLYPTIFLEDILLKMTIPLFIIYGENDQTHSSEKIFDLYSNSQFLTVDAGHCPQDEIPEIINPQILHFMKIFKKRDWFWYKYQNNTSFKSPR